MDSPTASLCTKNLVAAPTHDLRKLHLSKPISSFPNKLNLKKNELNFFFEASDIWFYTRMVISWIAKLSNLNV